MQVVHNVYTFIYLILDAFFCVFKKWFNLIYSSISIAIHYFCNSSYFGSFFKSSVSKKKNHPFHSLTVGVILKIWQILLKVDWSRDIWFFFLLPFLLWKGLDPPQVEEASFPLSVSWETLTQWFDKKKDRVELLEREEKVYPFGSFGDFSLNYWKPTMSFGFI